MGGYYDTGIRLDTSKSDTDFMFVSGPGYNSAGGGVLSTGVPADTNWHHLKIYWVATNTFAMSLDDGAVRTVCTSGCDLKPTASSASALPHAWCGSDTVAEARNMDIDFIGFAANVGAR